MGSIGTAKAGAVRDCWFDKMEGSLLWKIITPEISNPFNPPVPDKTLFEWLRSPGSLRRAMSIKVLCEGYEVMLIKNLQSPMFCADHPCINAMSFDEIMSYLERRGIEKLIDVEVSRMQQEIKTELDLRGAKPERIEAALRSKPDKKIPSKKRTNITTSAMVRIIRG